jgi:hypothetical protein
MACRLPELAPSVGSLPCSDTSGVGGEADMPRQLDRRVCGSRVPLFDHLVGDGEQRRRHVEAERLGGPEVDH